MKKTITLTLAGFFLSLISYSQEQSDSTKQKIFNRLEVDDTTKLTNQDVKNKPSENFNKENKTFRNTTTSTFFFFGF